MQKNNLVTNLVSDIKDLIENNPAIHNLKRQSKVLHKKLKEEYKTKGRNDFFTLRQCQDLVAQQHGYKHWHEFHTNIKKLYVTKDSMNLITYESPSIVPDTLFNKKPICLGYNKVLGLKAWINQDLLFNHMFIEGKKDFRHIVEFSLIKQLINEGQHVVYMDGNNSKETANRIIEYAKNSGREKDIRVLSFSEVNIEDSLKKYQWYLPKNLPFSSGGFTEMIYNMMDDNGIEDYWKGRAISLLSAILMALTYLRDTKELILDFEVIGEYLQLENLIKLKNRSGFPKHIQSALNIYLKNLPSYQDNLDIEQQEDRVLEMHGYLQMQLTKVTHILSNYKHLFHNFDSVEESRNKLKELYGGQNSLIFIIQFPNFTQSSYEMDILSKFIFGIILNSAATILGSSIESNADDDLKREKLFKERSNTAIFANNCRLLVQHSAILRQLRALHTSLILSYDNKQSNNILFDHLLNETSFKIKENKEYLDQKNNKILFNISIDSHEEILQIENSD